MDLTDPTRAITPTLDGPVLAVLAAVGRPLTVGEVAGQTPRGSEIGVRKVLARLVEQGIVRATEVGRSRVYELNADHVAARVAKELAGLRLEVWGRLRDALRHWRVKPMYCCVFGSAARGDGGPEGDVDLLVVHPPFPGETRPSTSSTLRGLAFDVARPATLPGDAERWEQQLADLHEHVRAWTGNGLQIVDLSVTEWVQGSRTRSELFREIERDAVVVVPPSRLAAIASRPARAE